MTCPPLPSFLPSFPSFLRIHSSFAINGWRVNIVTDDGGKMVYVHQRRETTLTALMLILMVNVTLYSFFPAHSFTYLFIVWPVNPWQWNISRMENGFSWPTSTWIVHVSPRGSITVVTVIAVVFWPIDKWQLLWRPGRLTWRQRNKNMSHAFAINSTNIIAILK